ncbi:HlyD family efflux transporter periplasmic adaptor subunit [Halomonas saccharevitans]|uniref:HlyD family efflux transporter periplasmic adaptor subunit n=1 Tax=Halomonas saccharevitans TaxID=416872 RepID=A0ABU3NA94_9GAMM|nr:HlyD family efflux transporter periplasmic adaptor subunit [Halomonas saccharevitans]MDT8878007.1 HlyD family efflux transporter periplasmic adaptor subunit [Halomonas saccharevitans]
MSRQLLTLRRLLWALAALIALGLLIWALRPMPVRVNTVTVQSAPFVDSVNEEGRTRLRDTWHVTAPITGYLRRVMLEVGDAVEQGQVLFRLEPSPAPALDARSREQAEDALQAARARLHAAEANLETARAEKRFAEAEYRRYQRLHERNLVSTADLEHRESLRDRQRALERSAASSVEAASFEVESARAVLAVTSGQRSGTEQPMLEVAAPVTGVVLERFRCCEGAVEAGQPIVEIGRLADMEILVDLLSMDAVRLKSGMDVHITGWGGAPLSGSVRRIEPAGFTRVSALGVDEQRVPVVIDFAEGTDAAAQGLGTGFRVEVEFLIWQADDVLQVPTSALFRDDGRWAAFAVEDGRARLRHLKIGRQSGLASQVLEGLEAGERIVTHPGDALTDGAAVTQGN